MDNTKDGENHRSKDSFKEGGSDTSRHSGIAPLVKQHYLIFGARVLGLVLQDPPLSWIFYLRKILSASLNIYGVVD